MTKRAPKSDLVATKQQTSKAPSKLAIVKAALARPQGATIAQLVEATGWQAHSVRGAISGSLKKKHGLKIDSAKDGDQRIYRIATTVSL